MVGLAKIVFGNAREMTALAKALNLKYDKIADIPFLLNRSKRVTVGVSSSAAANEDWLADNDIFVMTQGGSAPAIVVWGDGQSVQVYFYEKKINLAHLLINSRVDDAINYYFFFNFILGPTNGTKDSSNRCYWSW